MNYQSDDTACYRLVVMGSPRVGKSSLISMFLHGEINASYKPTVGDSHVWEGSQSGRQCRLDIIDTSGSNDFPEMRKLYIARGQIFLLVHSGDPETFEEVLRLLEEIGKARSDDQVQIFVVGNKVDQGIPNSISVAEAELRLIDYMNIVRYIEIDANNADSVGSIFPKVFDVVLGSCRRSNSLEKKSGKGIVRKFKSLRCLQR